MQAHRSRRKLQQLQPCHPAPQSYPRSWPELAGQLNTDGRSDLHLQRRISTCSPAQVLLYLPSRNQAWIVPQILVLLHLLIAHMKQLHSRHPEHVFNCPYCQPSSTSHEAHNVLKEHMNTRFLEHSLQQYQVADFLQSCQYILERLNHLTGPARLSQKFLGYEAADIIKLSESFTLKKGNTSTTGSA